MHAGKDTGANLPEPAALEIVRGNEHLLDVEEADIYRVAVGCGCG